MAVLISGFARNGFSIGVLDIFIKMQNHGVCLDQFNLSIVLQRM